MKTSQFARKHGVSQSAVGFYVKQGLLLPPTVNGRFDFGEQESADMKLIADLKRWQFSIDDISTILSETRLTKDSAGVYGKSKLLDMFRNKQNELLEERAKIDASLLTLEHTIRSLEATEQESRKSRVGGFDVQFLPYLHCPCGNRLTINLERIDEGKIHNGSLSCQCGYRAEIESGILTNPSGEVLPTPPNLRDYSSIDKMSREMRNDLFRIYNSLERMLRGVELKDKVVMETHIRNVSFVMQKARALDPSCLYVLSDPLREVVEREKSDMDAMESPLNALFIASNYQAYPLRRGCVDCIIDCFQNTYFAMFAGYFIYPQWLRYLRKGSRLIGAYIDIPKGSKSAALFKKQHPNGKGEVRGLDAFCDSLARHGFAIEQRHSIEPLSDSNYPWHHKGDTIEYVCYSAKLMIEPEEIGDQAFAPITVDFD
ncbi:MerR family transcriptional regulator [Synergistaceae bacterium OttesenSCG-928-I11]|nr:MerR family transcriptional regulator [Synergistaceae bacterium OttesenSCG-928-I11]